MPKVIIIVVCVMCSFITRAQKIENIFVNLYTDSLKKGTYNYINIDGLFDNGKYLPLDTSFISFSSSHGKFYGNSLFIGPDCKEEKISIHATLKNDPAIKKDIVLYVKKKEDPALKSEKEVLDEMRKNKKTKS